ncbi:hypothetical protein ACTA71_008372 [Dictyostelium dimigraforme]
MIRKERLSKIINKSKKPFVNKPKKQCKICGVLFFNIKRHLTQKHDMGEQYQEYNEIGMGYLDDENYEITQNLDTENNSSENDLDDDFNSNFKGDDEENLKDIKDTQMVKIFQNIQQYFISEELYSSNQSNQINDFEDLLSDIGQKYKVVRLDDNNSEKIYTSLETLVSRFKKRVLYKFELEPKKSVVEVKNKEGKEFKKTICYNEILDSMQSLLKIPHLLNKLDLKKVDIGWGVEVFQVNVGLFSDSFSKGKSASSNIINFTLEDYIDKDLKRYFIFPLACIKNEHMVKLTDQSNFQIVLNVIFKELVDFINNNRYLEVNGKKFVIKLAKIYGDLPGISLFLNIAYYSKDIGGCHSCLATSKGMNYIEKNRFEKKNSEKANELFEDADPIKKDQYGLKDPKGIFFKIIGLDVYGIIQKCFLHNDLLGMIKREANEVYNNLNKYGKKSAKHILSSLPIINGVDIRSFNLTYFVGKDFRVLLEVLSIFLSEIIQFSSSKLLKDYLRVLYLHEEYLKLLLNSKEMFISKEEKETAIYIIKLIYQHRREYNLIRKDLMEKKYLARMKRKKQTISNEALDKFKERGLMILHLGIHYIEDLETFKNPINHTGQDMEASICDYKRTESIKSNNKFGYSIMKSANLEVLERINSKIQKISNYENKCFYTLKKKQIVEENEKMKILIQQERNIEDIFKVSAVSSFKFRDQLYEEGCYISLDYEFNAGLETIEEINYSIINKIVEVEYMNKKIEILLLVDWSFINEYHTNIFRVMYDINEDRTIENSSIVSLYSLNNIVYRWDLSKENYGNTFTIIDLNRPKIFVLPDKDPSTEISDTKLKEMYKKMKTVNSSKKNLKKDFNTSIDASLNSTTTSVNNSYTTAFFKLNNIGFRNESFIFVDEEKKKNFIKYYDEGSKTIQSFEVGYKSLFQSTSNSLKKKLSTVKEKNDEESSGSDSDSDCE